MKKFILSVCTVLCLMTPLSAVEWGGLLFNDTGVSTPDFSDITVNQADGVSVWVKSPLGNSGLSFSSEVLYKFNIEIAKGASPAFTQLVDLPLLKVSGDLNMGGGILSLNAGRFYYVDGTSAVISQIIDGVSVAYALPLVKVGAFAGYTGLLNALNVQMAVIPEKDNKIYNMAYPYLPVGGFADISILGNQSLEFDGYYLLDLGSAEEKLNLCYINAILSGPITNIIYYNLATSLGFANFKDVMNYSSFSLLVFPTEALSLNAGVTFATTEQASLTSYTSLAPASMTAAGKITPKASLSFTTKNMCIDFGGNFVLAYNDSKYEPSNTDWNVGFIYNIFSDLQLGFNVNTSFDVTGANAHNYNAKLNLSLAF